jgi:ABC-type nitrate/sulfonate/bicarbonate transport system substrate-binding protein
MDTFSPMQRPTVTAAVFPGASNAPINLATQRDWFAAAGIEVEVIQVTSSDQQLELWEAGRCDVMLTSPDHLIRKRRGRDPVIARRDSIGELSVYRRADSGELAAIAWAVDGLDSGFAFVMRALLEDRCGLPAAEQRLHAVGGTKQRAEEMMAGKYGGTTLHPPFDRLAADAGHVRLAGHLDLVPQLLCAATVVARADIDSAPIRAYLEVLDRANELLANEGPAAVAATLEAEGLPAPVAAAAGDGLLGPGGIGAGREASLEGLRAVADLRARFVPGFSPAVELESLLAI